VVSVSSFAYVLIFQILGCFLFIESATEAVSLVPLLLVAFYLYEWGYLYNDSITIKSEAIPTLRVPLSERKYIENNIWGLLFGRLLFLGICENFLPGSYFLILIVIAFLVYNSIRGLFNAFLQPVLTTAKLFIPLWLSGGDIDPLFFGFYIIPNFIERLLSKKYLGHQMKRDFNYEVSRVYYFFFLLFNIWIGSHISFLILCWLLLVASFFRGSR
jgi:hypothetical protein